MPRPYASGVVAAPVDRVGAGPHLSKMDVNLCRQDTGAPVDLWLKAPTAEVTQWWLGELTWSQMRRHPGVTVHGDRALQRQMRNWFLRYAFARSALAQTSSA